MAIDPIRRPVVTEAPRPMMDGLLEWALSLPWVVERETQISSGLRTFAVDCEPLRQRRLWLVAGVDERAGGGGAVSVVVPVEVADVIEHVGWGRRTMPMPHRLEVVKAVDGLGPEPLMALLLTAYQYAMR